MATDDPTVTDVTGRFSENEVRSLLELAVPTSDDGFPTVEELESQLPGYSIKAIVGFGGMGKVYRGVQLSLDREVAVKILSPGIDAADPGFGLRFENEARAMARLSHPGIVAVIDAGETTGGLRYFVMEFVNGGDLEQRLTSRGKLPLDEALPLISEIGEALAFAHENGIVHRDIKPSNILIDRAGHIKVADFGLARVVHSGLTPAPTPTLTNVVMGSPDFLAPEAYQPGTLPDHRADIFALGAMFYQMLTSRIPRGRYEAASSLAEHVNPALDVVINKALDANPASRHQNVREFLADAQRAAHPRRRGVAGSEWWPAALAMIALLTLASWWSWRQDAAETPSGPTPQRPLHLPAFTETVHTSQLWNPAYETVFELDQIKSNAVRRDGWLVPLPQTGGKICLPPPEKFQGTNVGTRARFLWNDQPGARAELSLRKQETWNGPEFSTREYCLEVQPGRASFHYRTSRGAVGESNLELGNSTNIRIQPGQVVAVEAWVVGERLIGRINGELVEARTFGELVSGSASITSYQMSFRDLAFIRLDSLSEAKALQAAGMP